MKEKLLSYAQNNLPGAIYWEPDSEIKRVLSEVKPTNDFCKSMLGLNDYLTSAIPNLHQVARSNLIEVKKNKTVKWLDELPDDQQLTIINLAVKRREAVNLESRRMSEHIASQRKERMIQSHKCQEVLRRKLELEKINCLRFISLHPLKSFMMPLKKIKNESMTVTKKKKEVKIRKNL